jgi:DNA polymerase-3 subunit epsilon
LRGAQIHACATRVCRPRARLCEDDTRVHGLTDSDVTAAEPFDAEWTRFAALRETGVLAAHFSGTENALLRAMWPCPRLSPDFLEPGRAVAEWGPWIDTGRLVAESLPRESPAGLADVVGALGLHDSLAELGARWCSAERRRFHCALFDALACALVLQRLALDERGEPWSVARLVVQSTANAKRREERGQARLF